ncbi:MAG: ATP-dependent RNA helicase HrpA [Planctomycetota bacterium]|nr:ATP-dependent RNA helicase HrpA [Planctomycetota bacterium]
MEPGVVDLMGRIDACMLADRRRLRNRLRALSPRGREQPDPARVAAELARLGKQIERSERLREERQGLLPRPSFAPELPVVARREEIAKAIAENQVVIVCGQTGSGKSTQLPKICLELGRGVAGMIGQTQPRRIAARSIASRLAQELGVRLGAGVGYKVRFNEQVGPRTFVKIMTDGILLSETQTDHLLDQYDTLIIDEAHERSLNIDFILGYLRGVLPRRPDLKLIVTSATIDPQRFSEFFGGVPGARVAPVIEVSGRMFPVEVRYRPLGVPDEPEAQDDQDVRGIVDAVAEIERETAEQEGAEPEEGERGKDVLVFLPGEREIREAAEALRERAGSGENARWEILPLYARLPPEQQMRIFAPQATPRIVLSTNVAETSLTVPGVRYVIDTGLARIKRYSSRSKVQRLPIEEVSQASAEQRKGRCGRVSRGVCFRLYSQEDFERRPAFTAPEILRTNLANAILTMKALGLGDVEAFPFLDSPNRRAIQDGLDTLTELGALDEKGELTRTGRELAKLPVDPRIGRMILAARQEHCLREVLTIAAALAAGDPRLRPLGHEEEADRSHGPFRNRESDFVGFLQMWDFVEHESEILSNSRFRKLCTERFLSYVRVREWQDIRAQLEEMLPEVGVEPGQVNTEPASFAHIHRAVLTGLLSNVGRRQETGEYAGPRAGRFHIFPGSGLFAGHPDWIVAAELVETTRLYARTVARISPFWIERAGAHLVKRSYADAAWDPREQDVRALETVTIWGFPIVSKRKVSYGEIDQKAAREIFIYEALVEGRIESDAPFLGQNKALLADVRALEEKLRRRDLLAAAQQRYVFFDGRLPAGVYNARRFERWWHAESKRRPELLRMAPADVLARPIEPGTDARYPDLFRAPGLALPMEYRLCPGEPLDGVSVVVPVAALGLLPARGFDWLVPGMLGEKVEALIRGLPKELRVKLSPMAQVAKEAAEGLERALAEEPALRDRPLREVLADRLGAQLGVEIGPGDWREESLPPHLRMNFRVVDEKGAELAAGRDLGALQASWRSRSAGALATKFDAALARDGLTRWDFGDLPESVSVDLQGATVTGHPALVDRGESVSLRLMGSPAQARAASRGGLRRLFLLAMGSEARDAANGLPGFDDFAVLFAPLGTSADLREQILLAAIDRVMIEDRPGGPDVRTAMEFEWRWRGHAGRLRTAAMELVTELRPVLEARQKLALALDPAAANGPSTSPAWGASLADLRRQLARLFGKRFIVETPAAWLAQYPRYLEAALRRWRKLTTGNLLRDRQLAADLEPFERAHELAAVDLPGDERVAELRWLIEEWRVSLFAQELRTAVPVSQRRLEQAVEGLRQPA